MDRPAVDSVHTCSYLSTPITSSSFFITIMVAFCTSTVSFALLPICLPLILPHTSSIHNIFLVPRCYIFSPYCTIAYPSYHPSSSLQFSSVLRHLANFWWILIGPPCCLFYISHSNTIVPQLLLLYITVWSCLNAIRTSFVVARPALM
ncbi:hypothetical protein P691DRAFT_420339 [Macrolepiota fuliginosa MF-IS2]|uniref:Uncharacterized protein n=1 Tax=Macrolepiota fuliginosa MF-IS2 TaxID=1400762 RepID=A0A9P5XIH7_9AGAR|nr:hypothetical protein P691DRAFT_420339 [Macrolepiota fuliginosa MF-IS2]